jgi:hypothetical protein
MVLGEIIDAADIEAGAVHTIDRVCCFMEYLAPQCQLIRHLALQQPPEEPIVLVAGARVNVSTAGTRLP